jgi:hypothetical protein
VNVDFQSRQADSGVRVWLMLIAGISKGGWNWVGQSRNEWRHGWTTAAIQPSTFELPYRYTSSISKEDAGISGNMSKPIIQALTSLIPRHPGALPPELIELASSLLAQSRNKCSNLKPDEEIGRAYACANLACERYSPFYLSCLSYC